MTYSISYKPLIKFILFILVSMLVLNTLHSIEETPNDWIPPTIPADTITAPIPIGPYPNF
jgi:hypothetical protein